MARRLLLVLFLLFALLVALPVAAQSEALVIPTAFGQPSVEFSPDGNRVAVFENAGYAIAMESAPTPLNTVAMIYDTATGEALAALTGARDYIGSLIFTPDGAQVIGLTASGDVLTWDAATGDLLNTSRTLILNLRTPLFWHPQTGELVAAIPNQSHTSYVTLDPDSGALTLLTFNVPVTPYMDWIAAQRDRGPVVYNDTVIVPAPHSEALADLPLAGDEVWTVNPQGEIALLSLGSGERQILREGGEVAMFAINDLVATDSGLLGFTIEREDTVNVFNLTNGEETVIPVEHRSALLSPDGTQIAQYSTDATSLLVASVDGALNQKISLPDGLTASVLYFMRLRFSPDGERLVALGLQNADEQQHVVIYDL